MIDPLAPSRPLVMLGVTMVAVLTLSGVNPEDVALVERLVATVVDHCQHVGVAPTLDGWQRLGWDSLRVCGGLRCSAVSTADILALAVWCQEYIRVLDEGATREDKQHRRAVIHAFTGGPTIRDGVA